MISGVFQGRCFVFWFATLIGQQGRAVAIAFAFLRFDQALLRASNRKPPALAEDRYRVHFAHVLGLNIAL